MRKPALTIFLLAASGTAFGQVFTNATLTGKYYARHVQVTTDVNNGLTDARSIVGSLTFDGNGNYSFTGQQVVLTAAPAAFSVAGTYKMNAGGDFAMTNPQQSSLTLNARYGVDAVIGASTEAGANVFDMFIAIPAPASTATDSNSTLSVSYNFIDYELALSPGPQIASAGGSMQFDGAGNVSVTSGQGHNSSNNGGVAFKETPNGTYTVGANGSGSLTLPYPAGVTAATALFGSAPRTLAVSADGNLILAGTPGGHDILVGLRDAAVDNIVLPGAFSGRYWVTAFSVNVSTPSSTSVNVGSATVISADSAVVLTQREHQSSVPNHFYTTSASNFSTGKNAGSLTVGSSVILPGRGGNFAAVDAGGTAAQPDNTGYSLALLIPIPAVSGSGVFLNPQGVINAASNAPAGNPISPGEFIALYGSGLSSQTLVTAPPYPSSAGNVSISIGGLPAPVYLVSSGQINCLVPYGVSTASGTTTISVNNNGAISNTITVPVSATSPGIFSDDLSGTGDGAIVHLNGNLVNAANPAMAGEVLTIYLTGLGALQAPVKDGAAPNPPAADAALTALTVTIDGIPSPKVLYSGINPVYPGLYQVNFQMPQIPDHGEVSVLLFTSDSATQQITLFVQ